MFEKKIHFAVYELSFRSFWDSHPRAGSVFWKQDQPKNMPKVPPVAEMMPTVL